MSTNLTEENSTVVVKSTETTPCDSNSKQNITKQESDVTRTVFEHESSDVAASSNLEGNPPLVSEKNVPNNSLMQSSLSPTVSEVTSVASRDEKEKSDVLNDNNAEESNCFCGKVSKGMAMIGCDYCSDWYHMQCVQITRAQAKTIEKYACPRCTSKDETLHTIYKDVDLRERSKEGFDRNYLKKRKKERDLKNEFMNDAKKAVKENCENFRLPPGCNNCINCFRDADWRCGKCAFCESRKEPCLKRVCILQNENAVNSERQSCGIEKSVEGNSATNSASTVAVGSLSSGTAIGLNASTGKATSGHAGEKKRGRRRGWKKNKSDSNLRKRKRSSDKEDNSSSDGGYVGTDRTLTLEQRRKIASAAYFGFTQRNRRTPEEERQCFGPGCTLSARPGSKYCSDTCGLNLAKKRLNTILPGRVNNYWEQLPCASINSERQQAVLEEQLQQLTNDRRVIESYKDELQKWIMSILNIEPKSDDNVDDNFDWDFVLHCAVCTLEFPAKQIAKHAERCFVRTEKQSCYGAPNKAVANPCNLYCEAYNKINKTYCKRLRVLCSEHYKPGIEDEIKDSFKVCGFPLIWNYSEYRPLCKMFADPSLFLSKGFCLRRRKQCYQHHNWIQNVMGLIDVELMNKLIKIDECLGKKRWLQITDKLRGDVLSLMCNDTVHQKSSPETSSIANTNTASVKMENNENSGNSFACFGTEGGAEMTCDSPVQTEQSEMKLESKDNFDLKDDNEDRDEKCLLNDSHLSDTEEKLTHHSYAEEKSLASSIACDSVEMINKVEMGNSESVNVRAVAEDSPK
uniref:CXXC-type zinc finger protein 1 n=1 Tax=Syphacia muris TaxID=451379 RepID=A0A158R5M1_9BILA